MKKILLFLVVVGWFSIVSSQENQTNTNQNIDKSTLTLRPNSREFTPVRKTNMHQRMEIRRLKTIIQTRRGAQNSRQLRNGNLPNHRSQQVMRRNQQEMIKRQQQRMLRRKMILQQQRKLRRR